MRSGLSGWTVFLTVLALFCTTVAPAWASPWAEVGDNQLRGDIQLLADAGVIDDITTQWPLPWDSLVADLKGNGLAGQSAAVRAAAARVLGDAKAGNQPGLSGALSLDAGTRSDLVYGFDGMGRGEGQVQGIVSFNAPDFAARIALGAITQNYRGKTTLLMPDDSYVSAKLGDALVYGGWLSHWWGPGQISALSLSNNARPMPQIGIERLDTSASTWPVLRWLGPWQAEFFIGYMDGPRIQKKTFYNALRFTFSPAPGLEIGLARTEEFCGQGHPCAPLRDYFDFNNDPAHVNKTNDEGDIDVKYSHVIGGVPAEIYLQVMNEDTSPFAHSDTSHLFGASLFLPTSGNPVKLTAEYADSVPTIDIFSFGAVAHGVAYNNAAYPDGLRYRGRTLGFSLDSDSTLLSLQAGWTDPKGIFYELNFHHAAVSNPNNPAGNIVTTAPVHVNLGEARISLPLRGMKLDLDGRLQDDQPRPHKGFAASIEAALRINL
jgi:hypothetical protein